jgi:hypothetical protein
MGQQATQSVTAELIALLTLNDVPVLGLTSASVTAQLRKEGDAAFSAKSLADTAGAVTSSNAQTYALVDAQTLLVAVDGAAAATATFNTADFSDITNATAAEVAAVITTDISGATAAAVGGAVVITSSTTGATSSIQVTGGTANAALGFATNLNSGVDVFEEIGLGLYTINFFAAELDTLGSFTFVVDGSTIDQSTTIITIVAATETPTIVSTQTCTITGHVFDLEGNAIPNAGVQARVIGLPSIEQNQIAVSDDLVSTQTDSNGQFFLPLIRLADVELFIPLVNYRRQFVVPNSAEADVFTDL